MKLEIHYLYIAKYAKWIIISLISFFSLLIIIEWSSLVFSPNRTSISSTTVNDLDKGRKQDLADNLVSSSLFGVYVPDDLNSVKKSMLDVTLFGIILSNNMSDSHVILGSANGEEKPYRVGDKIPGGAVIKRITSEGLLVERNGVLESLSLPKNDLTFEPAAKPIKED